MRLFNENLIILQGLTEFPFNICISFLCRSGKGFPLISYSHVEFAKANPRWWHKILAEVKFRYFHWLHQRCDFTLCSEYLHITGESYLARGLNLLCKIVRFLKMGKKKRWSRAWLKKNWIVIRCFYECPASCSARAQVAVTGWLHKPVCEKQRLLSYWTYQNFSSEPVCCCCGFFTFGLHSCPMWLFKKTVFLHLVIWVLAGGHCVKFALRVLMGDLQQCCFSPPPQSWQRLFLGIWASSLCVISNPWQRDFYSQSFDHPTNRHGQLFTCTTERTSHTTIKGIFLLTVVLWAPMMHEYFCLYYLCFFSFM